ncbi:hypothetical protein ACQ4PT_021134 [Festuca glaucescens]
MTIPDQVAFWPSIRLDQSTPALYPGRGSRVRSLTHAVMHVDPAHRLASTIPRQVAFGLLTRVVLQHRSRVRSKYYQLSQQAPKDKIYYDKLKEYHRRDRLEERFCKCCEEDSKLDWYFHPDYCKLAGLEDYQRPVPRNYGGYEYVRWDEYHRDCHSYEIEQEYIKYCEELSKKLKWMEAYVPNKSPSIKWGRSLTRGTYQAIKIPTDFSTITGGLAFSGFYEWFDSMRFDRTFRDALDEVYKLNRFPLRQYRMKAALENDTFCSDLEEEVNFSFLHNLPQGKEKAQITEEKARELIAEALRKETQKPKFYEDYCR